MTADERPIRNTQEATMWSDLTVEERHDIVPLCPHCSGELTRIYARQLSATLLSKRFVYFCPHCLKTLGVTHRKGMLVN